MFPEKKVAVRRLGGSGGKGHLGKEGTFRHKGGK